jgi:hypothetical protein
MLKVILICHAFNVPKGNKADTLNPIHTSRILQDPDEIILEGPWLTSSIPISRRGIAAKMNLNLTTSGKLIEVAMGEITEIVANKVKHVPLHHVIHVGIQPLGIFLYFVMKAVMIHGLELIWDEAGIIFLFRICHPAPMSPPSWSFGESTQQRPPHGTTWRHFCWVSSVWWAAAAAWFSFSCVLTGQH